jgi:uncharacterized membrane protein YhaH (DUF805 family)
MRISEAVKSCFGQYTDFSGRASRPEFWKFVLFIFLTDTLLVIINSAVFGPTVTQGYEVSVNQAGEQSQQVVTNYMHDGGWLSNIFMLVVLLPFLAATWRRMHDIGRPGWHALLPVPACAMTFGIFYLPSSIVPIDTAAFPEGLDAPILVRLPQIIPAFLLVWALTVGSFIWVIVWLARRSDPNPNRFDISVGTSSEAAE